MKKCICFLLACLLLTSFCCAKKKPKKIQPDPDLPTEEVEYSISAEDLPEEVKVPQPKYKLRQADGSPVKLRESWGYVSQARVSEYNSSIPLTDVCFFAAEVNCYGELTGIPNRSKINTGRARCHLVIVCDSKSLTHFVLQPGSDVRKKLLRDIVRAGAPYDGVQIDFELVPARDRHNFITFLSDLRYMLGQKKWFTVCVPARFKQLTEDVYPYKEIAMYSDRVFVMAYDEHWSGGTPGPVASLDWCRKITEYAKKSIPEKKLIMGIPLYGRSWASETTAGAWYFNGANKIMTEHGVENVDYDSEIPHFKYTANVEVEGWFNDLYSVLHFCRLYESFDIHKMGFWRVGFEDPELWNWIKINR